MERLTTARLVLEPLAVADADAMFDVLADPTLYRYLDYPPPPSREHVRGVYARLAARQSPDGSQHWLNWIARTQEGVPIGFVQATVLPDRSAWVAYLVSSAYQGHGYATEAVRAMLEHLVESYGVECFVATVEARHMRSIGVLERLGFRQACGGELDGHELTTSELLFVRTAKHGGG
jgi:ribosomal-protein-alanine N-acetyltransferase